MRRSTTDASETRRGRRVQRAVALGVTAALALQAAAAVPTAFAASGTGAAHGPAGGSGTDRPPSLVALGDSITFGYNLADTKGNTVPSQSAYPMLIGKADHLSVSDLGVPGWTSADLLAALQTPPFAQAVAGASVVSVDIGSNDLLQPAAQMGLLKQGAADPSGEITFTPQEQQVLAAAVQAFGRNLSAIVGDIRRQTQAPILLYNLYNPFPLGTGLGAATEQLEVPMNQTVAEVAKSVPGVTVVDAHQAFDQNQLLDVRVAEQDVHPTPTGQVVLARIGEAALQPELSDVERAAQHAAGTAGTWTLQMRAVPAGGGSAQFSTGGSAVSLQFPAGSVKEGLALAVTTNPTAAAALAPVHTAVVASFGVNWKANAEVLGPYSVTVRNPVIGPGAAVYELVAGKLIPVSGAVVHAGEVRFPASGPAEYVVLRPVQAVVPAATKPVTGLPVRMEGSVALSLMALGGLLLWFARRRSARA